MKKVVALLLAAAMVLSLAACSNKESAAPSEDKVVTENKTENKEDSKTETKDPSTVTITVWMSGAGTQVDAMKAACEAFAAKTGYTVEFSAPGETYEEMMKTKMAADDMPDVFDTHGWSVARYSDYLTPINDMSFAANIDGQIKSAMSDENGNIYALPFDMDITGIVFNETVCAEAGVDVDEIRTWDDFTAACEKVKAIGKNPIHMGGANSFTVGWYYDRVAPSFYITDETNSKAAELKSGTFDTATWEKISALLDSWITAGYLNEDCVSGEYVADVVSIASDETAFLFYGNVAVPIALGINPDVKLGMMPIPSNSVDDEPTLIAGENVALGIWNETKVKAEAIELLEYLATPEVAQTIAEATGNKTALTNVTMDLGMIQKYLDKYSKVETFPYFDREYCPSGVWDVICSAGQEVLARKEGAIVDTAKQVQEIFNEKFE